MSLLTSNIMRYAIALELADWQRYQLDFTQHIRDPQHHPRPQGVNRQRMGIYTNILFNNVADMVTICFPVLSNILGKRRWQRLLRGFFATHRCQTPYVRHIPDEFLQYLQNEWQPELTYPDFILELAHYEWVELALSISNCDQLQNGCQPDADLLDHIPIANPVMMNLTYRYPVHKLSPRFKPTAPPSQATHLLVFRDADDEIHFRLQNPVTARLIDLIIPATMTGRQALNQLAIELQHPDPAALIAFGHDLLNDLHSSGCLMGARAVTTHD